jgi:mannose/fructose/N-acetylgalactosamine-specific phosphotransferase system component IIC
MDLSLEISKSERTAYIVLIIVAAVFILISVILFYFESSILKVLNNLTYQVLFGVFSISGLILALIPTLIVLFRLKTSTTEGKTKGKPKSNK